MKGDGQRNKETKQVCGNLRPIISINRVTRRVTFALLTPSCERVLSSASVFADVQLQIHSLHKSARLKNSTALFKIENAKDTRPTYKDVSASRPSVIYDGTIHARRVQNLRMAKLKHINATLTRRRGALSFLILVNN